VCTHYGVCAYGFDAGLPPDRGAFYHFVEVTVEESGNVSGLVYLACEGTQPDRRYGFGPQFLALYKPQFNGYR